MLPKHKNPCQKTSRSASGTPESKRKSLPHIGGHHRANSTVGCKSHKCRGRTGSRPRSSSVNDFHKGNWTRIFINLRKSSKYKAYGRSSDQTYGDPTHRQNQVDPYEEMGKALDMSAPLRPDAPSWLLVAEERLQARRLQAKEAAVHKATGPTGGPKRKMEPDIKGQPELNSCDTLHNSPTGDESSCSAAAGDSDKNISGKSDMKGKEETGGGDENDNDLDDDDEEDESGLPQAVRAAQQKNSTPTAKEILKERHRARMEEMANEIPADDLLYHLKEKGFFNYDYSRHARTNLTNHNLRIGKKKGIERLLVLLSFA